MNEAGFHQVVVVVFISRYGSILLVRQSYGKQYWSLPGGLVEQDESVETAAIREVKEETCLDIMIKRVVGIYSKPSENSIAISVEGKIIGGTLKPDNEIVECAFFRIDDLPQPLRDHFHLRLQDFKQKFGHAVLRVQ